MGSNIVPEGQNAFSKVNADQVLLRLEFTYTNLYDMYIYIYLYVCIHIDTCIHIFFETLPFQPQRRSRANGTEPHAIGRG